MVTPAQSLLDEVDLDQLMELEQWSKWLPLGKVKSDSNGIKVIFPDMQDTYEEIVQRVYSISNKNEAWSDQLKWQYIGIAKEIHRLAKEVFMHKRQRMSPLRKFLCCCLCPSSCAEIQIFKIANRLQKDLSESDFRFEQKISPRKKSDDDMKYTEFGEPMPPPGSDSLESLLSSSVLNNPEVRDLLLSSTDKSTEDHPRNQSPSDHPLM